MYGNYWSVVPPLALQRRYAEILEAVRAITHVRESSTGTVTALMGSLMSAVLPNEIVSVRGPRQLEAVHG